MLLHVWSGIYVIAVYCIVQSIVYSNLNHLLVCEVYSYLLCPHAVKFLLQPDETGGSQPEAVDAKGWGLVRGVALVDGQLKNHTWKEADL